MREKSVRTSQNATRYESLLNNLSKTPHSISTLMHAREIGNGFFFVASMPIPHSNGRPAARQMDTNTSRAVGHFRHFGHLGRQTMGGGLKATSGDGVPA